MKLQPINKLNGDEILGKNIFTNDGRILLKAGSKLNGSYVRKMLEMGIFYVYVEDERLSDVNVEDEKISRLKQTTLENMSRIMKNTSMVSDKRVMNEYIKVVEDLISYIQRDADVNQSLYDIQTYSNVTYVHSIDVCIMSTFIGTAMKLDSNSIKELGVAAILHDIGKIALPKNIVNKEGNFTEEELKQFKEHPYLGATILKKNLRISDTIVKAVQQHHERMDGKGYPYGMEGNSISKFARIITISDVYDTITNSREYKKSFTPNDAYELILAGSGTIFDKDIVKIFKKSFSVYPLGCCVKLSDGVEGYVVRQNENFPDRPVIRVIYNSETKKDVEPYEIDLVKSISLVITSIV
ncbi:HD family phosphohydrolase [Clostridium carboxidivorans P7]|uniref:Metal dependent phosphohydrolase n=1 Tax=Clostridium carboxidivorans P7 TaxID=536227 RepID=C6PPG5_9CLOT|nr:HD-GYP domain-containing protein [Clostridium carboxidivorans]AKN33937.1 HD family phosphohydrolase [Clostridium carboxidivorans P7]EET88859.1 metal dependent phosphohydrolase [Clostridium carboxidivorans P7]EFG88189.1 HD domain protein [Clostridium carboxidivorans P7]